VESCDRHEQIAAAARIYATALLDVDRVAIALALSAKRIIDLNQMLEFFSLNRTAIALIDRADNGDHAVEAAKRWYEQL
jgi:hypothetical protein